MITTTSVHQIAVTLYIPREIKLIYCEKRSINILHYKIFKNTAYETQNLIRVYYF